MHRRRTGTSGLRIRVGGRFVEPDGCAACDHRELGSTEPQHFRLIRRAAGTSTTLLQLFLGRSAGLRSGRLHLVRRLRRQCIRRRRLARTPVLAPNWQSVKARVVRRGKGRVRLGTEADRAANCPGPIPPHPLRLVPTKRSFVGARDTRIFRRAGIVQERFWGYRNMFLGIGTYFSTGTTGTRSCHS